VTLVRRPTSPWLRMLRTGLVVLLGSAAAQVIVSELIWANGVHVPRIAASLVSPLLTAGFVAGATLVAGAYGLRETSRTGSRHGVDRTEQE